MFLTSVWIKLSILLSQLQLMYIV